MNYRGSTIYERGFRDKILGKPGCRELEDIIAARDFLGESGIADPDRVLAHILFAVGEKRLNQIQKRSRRLFPSLFRCLASGDGCSPSHVGRRMLCPGLENLVKGIKVSDEETAHRAVCSLANLPIHVCGDLEKPCVAYLTPKEEQFFQQDCPDQFQV